MENKNQLAEKKVTELIEDLPIERINLINDENERNN